MTRESILMLLGILVALSPWSGIPLAWLSWLLIVLGLAVAFIGFTQRSRANSSAAEPIYTDPEPLPRATRIASS